MKDGELAAAAQRERYPRRKHDARFLAAPSSITLNYYLEPQYLRLSKLHRIELYDKSPIKFERLSKTEMS